MISMKGGETKQDLFSRQGINMPWLLQEMVVREKVVG